MALVYRLISVCVKMHRQTILSGKQDIKRKQPHPPDFRRLFNQLNTLQGSYESRLKVVKEVVNEASRFKRHSLVKLLTQFLDSMTNMEKGLTTQPSLRVNGHSR